MTAPNMDTRRAPTDESLLSLRPGFPTDESLLSLRPGFRRVDSGLLFEFQNMENSHELDLQSFQGPQRESRPGGFVRADVPFYTGQDVLYNYPELKVQEFLRGALGAPCGLKNSAKGGESSNPSAVLSESEKIEHVDADPVTNPLIAANKIDGKLEENDYLNKAVKADANGCDSTSQPLEELDGSHEYTDDIKSENEGLSSGSSSESQEEVTGDSPGLETNSNCVGINEDDIISMLAPLLKQQIEGALKSTLLPLVAILRSREEDEQKHRVQMLALEEQKLALKREKLLFKRRRVD